ncbi:MAG: hypothetical protein ABI369_10235 [Acetobacteraceae bacterium]
MKIRTRSLRAALCALALGAFPVVANATLGPGKYLMICNQPTHYAAGMKMPFTVTR